MRNDRTHNEGAVLLTVVLISTLVMGISIGCIELSLRSSRVQNEQEDDIKCVYLAHAGLNIALAGLDFCALIGPNCTLGPIAPCGDPTTSEDDLLIDCPAPVDP